MYLHYLKIGLFMKFKIILLIVSFFTLTTSGNAAVVVDQNDHASGFTGKHLKIGVLRHLTVEEAEQKNIDTQAEKLLIEAAKTRGHQIEFINPLQYEYSTSGHLDFDVIVSRAEINDPYEPVTDSYFRALDYFESLGIPIINSSQATLNAQDKFRTLLLAKKAGIRVPLTFLVHSIEAIKKLVRDGSINYPFFVKKPYGGAGSAVFKVKDEDNLTNLVKQSFKQDELILVEEKIDLETDENGNVKDMRTWVVRDSATNRAKFIGGTYRTAASGHYLTNLYAGGRVSPLNQPFDPKVVEMSERALESIGADVAGIDIGRDKYGTLYLIEVNISFYTGKVFQDAIGENIWELVMDLAEARVKKAQFKIGTSNKIKIVSSFPRQGDIQLTTNTFVNAFKMALDEADYKVGNYDIIYEDWDNSDENGHWVASKEAENAKCAILDPEVMLYIGPGPSGAATISLPILNRAHLTMISPSASYPGLTKAGKKVTDEPKKYQPTGESSFLRMIPTDDIQGSVAAQWVKKLGLKSVYIISDGDLYGEQLASIFLASAKENGLEIKNPDGKFETINPKKVDFKDIAKKISLIKPDLVFVGINASNNAGRLWQDLRASPHGDDLILMGGDNLTALTFLKEAGNAAENTYIVTGGVPPQMYQGKAAEWAEKYRKKYKTEPTFYAIYAYEAMKVSLDAISRSATKDRVAIRNAAFTTHEFAKGALNPWSFDLNGDISLNTMSISQVKNGKIEFITELK
jgi:branched-chain amino acid transport system substrate-binding protein